MSAERYVAPYYLALVYMGLGERDQAINCLEKAYGDHSEMVLFLPLEPKFDGLRADPRFQRLVRAL